MVMCYFLGSIAPETVVTPFRPTLVLERSSKVDLLFTFVVAAHAWIATDIVVADVPRGKSDIDLPCVSLLAPVCTYSEFKLILIYSATYPSEFAYGAR